MFKKGRNVLTVFERGVVEKGNEVSRVVNKRVTTHRDGRGAGASRIEDGEADRFRSVLKRSLRCCWRASASSSSDIARHREVGGG